MKRFFWWLDTRFRFRVRADHAVAKIARWMPRPLRRAVIVNAAVEAREPERRAGDRYCGPDGLTYGDLWDHA